MDLSKLIVTMVILSSVWVLIFLACRELACWYWKINRILKLQEEANGLARERNRIAHSTYKAIVRIAESQQGTSQIAPDPREPSSLARYECPGCEHIWSSRRAPGGSMITCPKCFSEWMA